eukprot:jgi/Chrzof1/4204/Cz14g03010.t1
MAEIPSGTLRVGIIGAASIAKKAVNAAKFTEGRVEIVAVGSRRFETACQFVKEAGLVPDKVTAYGTYEEVIEDSAVDAVYIPLPAGLHKKYIAYAAKRGKHILCEKPIALNADDTAEIYKIISEHHNIQWMDGTMWAHHPRTAAMEKAMLQDKKLGDKISQVISTFTIPPSCLKPNDVRFQKHLDGLGCLGDLGWYCVYASLWAMQWELPDRVQVHPMPKLNQDGIPIQMGGTLCWSNDRRADFTCSFTSAINQEVDILGSTGTLEVADYVAPFDEPANKFRIFKDLEFTSLPNAIKAAKEETEASIGCHD